MCGIAGILAPFPELDLRARITTMLEVIRYRGPDSSRAAVADGFALGMVRLAIVNLEGGAQPAVAEDESVLVVFNGEIFNYLELRDRLRALGDEFRFGSEVEVLLRLYQRYGIKAFEQLNGQFAIAILDRRTTSLHLARDPFGIRPLFWASHNGNFYFASEIKSILANRDFPSAIDPLAVAQTLRYWTCVGTQSAFKEIQQVPPGHSMTWQGGTATTRRFWSWPFSSEESTLRLQSDEEYAEAFREALSGAVRRQTMADVEVGAYLSGGIDSSVIVHELRRANPQVRLSTFSVGFADAAFDESAMQKAIVEKYSTNHHTSVIDNNTIADNFSAAVVHAETPLFRTAPIPMYCLSDAVRSRGIKVVLSGEGADEILLGYDLFREACIRQFWARRPQSRWRGRLIGRLYDYLPQYRNPRYLNLLLDFYRPTLAGAESPHYAMAVRWNGGKALLGCLAGGRAESIADDQLDSRLNAWLPPGFGARNVVERAQVTEVMTLLGNYLLSSQGDRMSLAHSVEGRYPYLDLEFVKFCARLPQRLKLRGLKDKFILRRAYKGMLPEQIVTRKKFAYQAPDKQAFFHNGRPNDWVADMLSKDQLVRDGIFDPDYVSRFCLTPPAVDSGRQGIRNNMLFIVALSTSVLVDRLVRNRPQAGAIAATPVEFVALRISRVPPGSHLIRGGRLDSEH